MRFPANSSHMCCVEYAGVQRVDSYIHTYIHTLLARPHGAFQSQLMPNIKDKMLLEGVILLEYNKEKASSRGLFVIHPMVFLLF